MLKRVAAVRIEPLVWLDWGALPDRVVCRDGVRGGATTPDGLNADQSFASIVMGMEYDENERQLIARQGQMAHWAMNTWVKSWNAWRPGADTTKIRC